MAVHALRWREGAVFGYNPMRWEGVMFGLCMRLAR
jgi:hypothetical protein